MNKLLSIWPSLLMAVLISFNISSCAPEEEEGEEEQVVHSDLTGDFEGTLTNDSLGRGYVLYSFESSGTSTYTMYFEGTAVGEATVTQTNFTVEPGTNADFTELSGYINEDGTFIYFSGTGILGESFSFSGDLLEGDRVETHMTINGQDYSHWAGTSGAPNCSDIGFTFSMYSAFMPKGALGDVVSFDLEFELLPVAGTYNIIDGIPSGSNCEVEMYWQGVQIQASSGSVAVSGSGTESTLSVQLNNTVFDVEAFDADPVTPVTASGTVKCDYD